MKVIIAAAGTGGHINPGIAIANKIKEKEPDSEIIFIGTGKQLEKDLVLKAGYKLETINAYGLSKKISLENIKKIIKTIKGFSEAKEILKKFNPDVVIGTGGYICGAVISSAHKLKIPTMLHESNAYPGLALKILAKKTDVILLGIEETKKYLKKYNKIEYTGTPSKVKKLNLSIEEKVKIILKENLEIDKPIVLVFGGSQGAKKINETIIKIIEKRMNKDYQIIWASGQEQYETVKERLSKSGLNIENLQQVKIIPYIYNMSELMEVSDLIIARSGAMTLTELSILEKPAIFIPLPSKSANRQENNARVFEKIGAGKVILNNELNEENLSKEINNIINNKNTIKVMSSNAKKIAIYDAEERIYKEIKKLIKK